MSLWCTINIFWLWYVVLCVTGVVYNTCKLCTSAEVQLSFPAPWPCVRMGDLNHTHSSPILTVTLSHPHCHPLPSSPSPSPIFTATLSHPHCHPLPSSLSPSSILTVTLSHPHCHPLPSSLSSLFHPYCHPLPSSLSPSPILTATLSHPHCHPLPSSLSPSPILIITLRRCSNGSPV